MRRVDDGDAGELGQPGHGRRGAPGAAAGEQDRAAGAGAARPRSSRRSRRSSAGRATGDAGTTSASRTSPRMSIGTDTRTGPGPARERRVPRPGQDPRHLVRPTDAPGALHERLVDRDLVRVAAEVELLVRAAPLVVRRDVARRSRPAASSRRPPSRRPSPRSSCPARHGRAATPGRPLARANPSAACAATCSWRVVTKRGAPSRSNAARSEMFVWPHSPKTSSTPRSTRNRGDMVGDRGLHRGLHVVHISDGLRPWCPFRMSGSRSFRRNVVSAKQAVSSPHRRVD